MRYSFVFSALTAASLVTASYLDDYPGYSRRDNQDIDAYIQARNYDEFQFNLMPRVPEPKGTSGGAPKAAAPASGGGGKPAKGSEVGGGGKAAKGSGEGAKPGKEGKSTEGGMKGAGKEGKVSKEGKAGAKEGKTSEGKAGLKSTGKEGKEKGSSSKFSMGKSEDSSKKKSSRFGTYKGRKTSSSKDGSRGRSSIMDRLRRLSPGRSGKSRSEGKAGGASGNKPPFKDREEAARYLSRPGSPKGADRPEGKTAGMNAGMGGAGMKAGQGTDAAGGDDSACCTSDAETTTDRSITKLHRRDFGPLSDAYVMIRKRSGKGNMISAKVNKQESPPRSRALPMGPLQSRLPRLEHILQQNVGDLDQGHVSPPANPHPSQPSAGSSNSGTMSVPSASGLGKKTNSAPNLSHVRQVRMEIGSPPDKTKPPVYPKPPAIGRVLIPGNQLLGNVVPFPRRTPAMVGNVPPPTRLREPTDYTPPTEHNTPTLPNQVSEDWVLDKWLRQSRDYDGHAPPSP